MDFYKILEIDHYASDIEIKKSYRRLAKLYHPDKYNDDFKMKNLNLAYEVLSDKKLKEEYDNTIINNEEPYDLIQSIIKKNKLDILNHLFSYIYDDTNILKNDINEMNIMNMIKKIKNKVNLDIKSEIELNLKDIYFNKTINLIIKRSINKNLLNYEISLNIDIYDEEILYENLGDELFFMKGELLIIPKLIYDDNLYCILDNYNLQVNINDFNFKLFDEINLIDLDKKLICKNNKFSIYEIKNYGFFNENTNKRGNLYIKINNIYI